MVQRKPSRPRPRPPTPRGGADRRGTAADGAPLWLYGAHAVLAALENPRRRCRRLLLGPEAAARYGAQLEAPLRDRAPLSAQPAARAEIARHLHEGAVHQGLALLVEPLAQPSLAETLERAQAAAARGERPVLVVLDQVTDPQNVGAILRSAAAFGALAVLATARRGAPESGALAKAASGALEYVPYLQLGNLARTLDTLKAAGFWRLGLAGEAEASLAEADPGGAVALVLGAEGAGLRRLTRETCDLVARLPTRGPIDTLNVSTAAAVALYELLGRRSG